MTTFSANDFKPFRLGLPTLPARQELPAVDPYASRAVATVAGYVGALRYEPPGPGIANRGGRDQWIEQDVRALAADFFRGPANPVGGVDAEQLLAQDGKTPLVNAVRRELRGEQRPLNATAILGNEVLFHFLLVVAIYKEGLPDAPSIVEWLLEADDGGVANLYPFVVIAAVEDYAARNRIDTKPAKAWEDYLTDETTKTRFSFASGVFEASLKRFVEDFTFRRSPLSEIRAADTALGLGITPEERDYLVRYFQQSGITLAPANRNQLVSSALLQRRSSSINLLSLTDSVQAPLDFHVDYHTDTTATTAVNADNVRCAAQLFYVMTLGDELGVFRAADLLVAQHLSRGRIDIRSPQLLRDLQDYVLNEEFPGRQGLTQRRTSEEERRMFYRQVFDVGDTELMDGMVTNTEFGQLWTSLMVETVRFLEKVEHAENPVNLVSRTPITLVMQDLQYNLSTHASGMAKILAPLVYQELDFLIERIFKSPEIIDQLALHASGSYWRVIERLLQEGEQRSLNITALQKKAQLGHQILTAVADFSESVAADDTAFFALVSQVEGFIRASEQLEGQPAMEPEPPAPPLPVGVGGYGGPDRGNGHAGQDDWSF